MENGGVNMLVLELLKHLNIKV